MAWDYTWTAITLGLLNILIVLIALHLSASLQDFSPVHSEYCASVSHFYLYPNNIGLFTSAEVVFASVWWVNAIMWCIIKCFLVILSLCMKSPEKESYLKIAIIKLIGPIKTTIQSRFLWRWSLSSLLSKVSGELPVYETRCLEGVLLQILCFTGRWMEDYIKELPFFNILFWFRFQVEYECNQSKCCQPYIHLRNLSSFPLRESELRKTKL